VLAAIASRMASIRSHAGQHDNGDGHHKGK
jgi:hypothetical protein